MKTKWTKGIDGYSKHFNFKTFADAMVFLNAVAWLAQQQNHHPLITLDYTNMKLTYITGDMNPPCITEKDEAAILAVDTLFVP